MAAFLEADALSYGWTKTLPALQAIHFQLERGQRLCICGCNGGGKSTLLQLLSGILVPLSGTVLLEGTPADADRLRARAALLMQDADMQIIGSTVGEDLLLSWAEPTSEQTDKAQTLASRFELLDLWDRPVHALSYGQKRKLCLCTALLSEPDILLLDEPCSGLDYPAMIQLRKQLQESRKLTQLITTHDLEPLIDLVDSVLILHRGQQTFFGSPEAALKALEQHPEWGIRLPCLWKHEQHIISWEV